MRHRTCVSIVAIGSSVGMVLAAASVGCRASGPSTTFDSAASPSRRDWPAYGGGPEGIRFSSLNQITRQNVTQLQVAWTYDSGETGGLQTNPVVIGDVVYVNTPSHKVVALDGATGAVRWRFDAGVKSSGANRGVMYWTDGANESRIFAAVDRFVYAIDAKTGAAIPAFGQNGRIDLHDHLGRPPSTSR